MGKRTNLKSQEEINARYERCFECLDEVRRKFLEIEGVIGVGIGPKEKGGQLLEDQPVIVVYVTEKKDKKLLKSDELIPTDVMGVPTDVVVPGKRRLPYHYEHDFAWVDWAKVHARNPFRDVNLEPMVDYDVDHVAVVEIDDTFLVGSNVDWVKAVKRFLQSHPDVFDFITFYVDTASGLSGQGSWHSGVYNKTKGINYYAGDNLNVRSSYGSTTLQAILSIGWLGNAVLLQETGHMWGAYVRNRDTQTGSRLYDLLMGSTGQGIFHWGRFFDNDHSPMDYDGIDWEALGGSQFQSHGVADDYYHFYPLDLYLMGLIPPGEVGSFYVIQNPSANTGTITGTPKTITVQNVIWAEGARDPTYPNTQRVWKQAFVLLTKNAQGSSTLAQNVAQQRREFTWQLYKATRFLGKVDTTLTSYILLPDIREIAVALDNDRAVVGWKTNIRTRGQVNYATTPAAFRRDQAHTEPFSQVAESTFGTSHGLLLTGLTPNTTYFFEIIAETEEGLLDRQGVDELYTRKTKDTCPPDINNVSVQRKTVWGSYKVIVSWKTDEPSDSRVYYGTSTPPAQQSYDPYPTTSHSIRLKGLSAGTYYLGVESRDAAGNVARDDNSGNYYQVIIPANAPTALTAVDSKHIMKRIQEINVSIKTGNIAKALEMTSRLVVDAATDELGEIVQKTPLPKDDLDAGYAALQILASRLEGRVEVVDRDPTFIDFVVEPEPLSLVTCIHLPTDLIARRSVYPVLPRIMAKVRPGLVLTPHPARGMGYYRLRKAGRGEVRAVAPRSGGDEEAAAGPGSEGRARME